MREFEFIGARPDFLKLVIEGKRICLISISEKFTQDIFNEFSSDITAFMFPMPAQEVSETQAFIRSSIEAFREANNLQMVILQKRTKEFLGCCGLHGSKSIKSPELGIWLKKSAHGQGLGKEAIYTLIQWAQENIKLNSFIYPVDKRNQPSRNIPLSLGAKMIGNRNEVGMAGNSLELEIYEIPSPLPAISYSP